MEENIKMTKLHGKTLGEELRFNKEARDYAMQNNGKDF